MKKYIISWGGGVNSTAIIAMIKLGMLPGYTKENSHIVMANTGCEMPYTYEHTNLILSPLAKEGWIAKVLSPDTYPEYYSKRCQEVGLPEYCMKNEIIPSRINRWCTMEYKNKPIREYREAHGIDVLVLGIAAEEKHRAKALYANDTDYPLIRKDVDRDRCIELIAEAGLPEARKSGCSFCPYQRKAQWIELYKNYPDLFKQAEDLEKNALARYKRLGTKSYYLCRDIPIRKQIMKWLDINCQQQTFDDFGLDQHCFCAD